MTLELAPWKGDRVPVLSSNGNGVSRSSFGMGEYLAMLEASWRYGGNLYPTGTQGVTYTQNGQQAEPVGNNFEGYVRGLFYADGPVAAVEWARVAVFSQAPPLFQTRKDGRPGDLYDDESLDLVRAPWVGGTTSDLMARALLYADFGGNAYVVIADDELVVLRPDYVEIVLEPRMIGGAQVGWKQVGITYQEAGTGRVAMLMRGEYAHFAPKPDPLASYRGMSWLTPVIREIQADISAVDARLAFQSNSSTPNLAVKVPQQMTPDQFRDFVDMTETQHRGPVNSGKTLYVAGGADVTVVGSSMKEMDYTGLLAKSETRTANAGGIHPAIVGFSEGLSGSSLNAGNYQAAKRQTVDMTFRSLWANWVGSLQVLFPPPKAGDRLWYDIRDVAFLHDDAKDLAAVQQTQGSVITTYVREGFTPDSAVDAVRNDDISRLQHTGLTSVQLTPPADGETPPADVPAEAPTGETPPTDETFTPVSLGEEARAWLWSHLDDIKRGHPHPGQRFTHGWKPVVPGDNLRLAGRIDLNEGETLTGSDLVEVDDSVIPLAWVATPTGPSLRIGFGVGTDDQHRWRGANLGSTVVLDEAGTARLNTSLRDMAAAGAAGTARAKGLDAQLESAQAEQRALIRKQYPHLSAKQAKDLDRLDEEIPNLTARVAGLERRRQERIGRLSPAGRAEWDRRDAEIGRLTTERDAALSAFWAGGGTDDSLYERYHGLDLKAQKARNEQIGVLEELDPPPRYGVVALARRDQEESVRLYDRLGNAQNHRDELTRNPGALQAADAARLDEVTSLLGRLEREFWTLVDDQELAAGAVPGRWGDIVYRVGMDDSLTPHYSLAVRPPNAPADWEPGHNPDESRLDDGELRKLIGLLSASRPAGEASRAYRYRHGWVPISPLAVLPPDVVDEEYGRELDSVEFGDTGRIVARENGVTVESDSGSDIAIHATPSSDEAQRWATVIEERETFTRQSFATELHEGGIGVRFGDHEVDLDDAEAHDVAQALRDMAYITEDHQNPPTDDVVDEGVGDETPLPDAARSVPWVWDGVDPDGLLDEVGLAGLARALGFTDDVTRARTPLRAEVRRWIQRNVMDPLGHLHGPDGRFIRKLLGAAEPPSTESLASNRVVTLGGSVAHLRLRPRPVKVDDRLFNPNGKGMGTVLSIHAEPKIRVQYPGRVEEQTLGYRRPKVGDHVSDPKDHRVKGVVTEAWTDRTMRVRWDDGREEVRPVDSVTDPIPEPRRRYAATPPEPVAKLGDAMPTRRRTTREKLADKVAAGELRAEAGRRLAAGESPSAIVDSRSPEGFREAETAKLPDTDRSAVEALDPDKAELYWLRRTAGQSHDEAMKDLGAAKPAKKAPAAKRAPKKKAAPVAPAVGHEPLSSDPAVRAVQVENRIRGAYRELSRQPGDWVPLAQLREKLGDLGRADVDEALLRMGRGSRPSVHLAPQDYPFALTPRDRDASVSFGGRNNHIVLIEDPSDRPLPAGAASSGSDNVRDARTTAALRVIAKAHNVRIPSKFRTKEAIREYLLGHLGG